MTGLPDQELLQTLVQQAHRLPLAGWVEDTDEPVAIIAGRWAVVEADVAAGLSAGQEGTMTARLVGAASTDDLRAAYYLRVDGGDRDVEVRPGQLEQL